jgi:hypothetical protein
MLEQCISVGGVEPLKNNARGALLGVEWRARWIYALYPIIGGDAGLSPIHLGLHHIAFAAEIQERLTG